MEWEAGDGASHGTTTPKMLSSDSEEMSPFDILSLAASAEATALNIYKDMLSYENLDVLVALRRIITSRIGSLRKAIKSKTTSIALKKGTGLSKVCPVHKASEPIWIPSKRTSQTERVNSRSPPSIFQSGLSTEDHLKLIELSSLQSETDQKELMSSIYGDQQEQVKQDRSGKRKKSSLFIQEKDDSMDTKDNQLLFSMTSEEETTGSSLDISSDSSTDTPWMSQLREDLWTGDRSGSISPVISKWKPYMLDTTRHHLGAGLRKYDGTDAEEKLK